MAFSQAKHCLLIGRNGSLLFRPAQLSAAQSVQKHRQLTTNPDYKKPWPYKKKTFHLIHGLIDFTSSRMNENSRILQIEGPPCVGKSEFAKKLADHFKLKYLPAIGEEELHFTNGFDLRQLNELLPTKSMKYWDVDGFYTDRDPDNFKYYAKLQINFFEKRYYQYIEALQHVLHTGQGVVIENSVWGDICYALTMAENGYFTKKAIKWYMNYRKNTLNFLWHPHLIIHLDAPSSFVVKKMKEKKPQYEDSPILSEKFFDQVREKYEKVYLPYMSERLDILTYDATKMDDFDLLAMDMESMDLLRARFGESIKFSDWKKKKEEEWAMYRLDISNPVMVRKGIDWRGPYDCPELWMDAGQEQYIQLLMEQFPQLAYGREYWYDKDGKFIHRPELNDPTPLSLARNDPICMQGVGGTEVKQVSA